nr:protein phosphatase 2C domain-containing protein [Microbulbifer celer]
MPRSAGATHTGYRRDQNEDAFWGDEERGVWVVADGLGGHQAGEIASQTVVEEIQRSSATDRHYEQALRRAHALLAGEESSTAMGTTAVVIAEDGDYFHIYWVGDSRAYLWTPAENATSQAPETATANADTVLRADQSRADAPGGQLQQLTIDHSYVQMLVDSGAINADEAANHPNRHVITRCIGGSTNPQLEIDRASFSWKPGQKLLLCSDGLSNEVDEDLIKGILAGNADNQRAVDLLIAAALDGGGRDNVTVQLISAPEPLKPDSQNQMHLTDETLAESRQFPTIDGKLSGRTATIALVCLAGLAAAAVAAWQWISGN